MEDQSEFLEVRRQQDLVNEFTSWTTCEILDDKKRACLCSTDKEACEIHNKSYQSHGMRILCFRTHTSTRPIQISGSEIVLVSLARKPATRPKQPFRECLRLGSLLCLSFTHLNHVSSSCFPLCQAFRLNVVC